MSINNHPYLTQSQIERLVPPPAEGDQRLAWQARAKCRDHDPEIFHPTPNDHARRERAKQICAGCPVAGQCLQWALEMDEPNSVYGGLDGHERRALARSA